MRRIPWKFLLAVYFALHLIAALVFPPLLVATVAIAEAAILWWLFVGMYARVGWNTTGTGVQIMSLAAYIALLTTVSLIPNNLGLGTNVGLWVDVIIVSMLPVLAVNMIHVLVRAQRAKGDGAYSAAHARKTGSR